MWYGVVTHWEVVTGRHMLGYAVLLAGLVVNPYSRQREGSSAAPRLRPHSGAAVVAALSVFWQALRRLAGMWVYR